MYFLNDRLFVLYYIMQIIIIRDNYFIIFLVIPTIKEPIPGWVDSLNGPVGVLAAAGKGVIRSMLAEEKNHAEIIPVDIAVNGMITAAWHRGNNKYIVNNINPQKHNRKVTSKYSRILNIFSTNEMRNTTITFFSDCFDNFLLVR